MCCGGNGDGLICKKPQTITSHFSSLSSSRAAPSPSWQHVSVPPSLPEWLWLHRWSRWTQSRPPRSRYGWFPVLSWSSWIFQPVQASKRWPAGVKPHRLFWLTGLLWVETCFRAETHRLIHWWSILRCSWRRSWTTWCPAWLWDPSSLSGSLGTRSRWALWSGAPVFNLHPDWFRSSQQLVLCGPSIFLFNIWKQKVLFQQQ